MPAGALFKLSIDAIKDIASHLQEVEDSYAKKLSRSEVWRETDFDRELYTSLKREEDEWRGKQTVEKVAEKLGRELKQVVRLILKGEQLISPDEYFDVPESPEERIQKMSKDLEKLDIYGRDLLEAIIEVLQHPEFETSRPALVALATTGFLIAKNALDLDDASIVEIAKQRRKIKKKNNPLGLNTSISVGVINIAFLNRIDAALKGEEPVEIPTPALFDLSVALGVLPSAIISPSSPMYEKFVFGEKAALANLDQSS